MNNVTKNCCLYYALLLIGMMSSNLIQAQCGVSTTDYIHCAGKILSTNDGLNAVPSGCLPSAIDPVITWWDAATGGNQVATGGFFQPTLNLDSQGQEVYYAQSECDGCISTRTAAYFSVADCAPVDNGCTYLLVLEDSENDGWDGASIAVTKNEFSVAQTYSINTSYAGKRVIPISLANGGILDFEYFSGVNESEHSLRLLDPLGAIALDANGNPFEYNGNIPYQLPRVKIDCPEICDASTMSAKIRIHLGTTPAEQSWELLDSDGTRVLYSNGNAYAGLAPGGDVELSLLLDICEAYTFRAFDGANNGWAGGFWSVLSGNRNYGTASSDAGYVGYQTLISTENQNFVNEIATNFTIPCTPECPDRIIATAFDKDKCAGNASIPLVEANICYPHANHALGCDLNEFISIQVNGDADNTIIVGGFDPTANSSIDVIDLPIGLHDLIYEIRYCDGMITRCTSEILVSSATNPTMVCLGDVTVPLNQADNLDDNNSDSFVDDFGECVVQVKANQIINIGGDCAAEATNEYELIIFDANNNPLIQYDANGNPLDRNGDPILAGSDESPAHDIVGPAQVGQTLKYQLTHLLSGHVCCGDLEVQDKTAPYFACKNYTIACTHPEALNPFYFEKNTYYGEGLPANIAGGNAGLVSVTEIPIEVACGSQGEIVQYFDIHLEIEHTDIEDLRILLTPPSAMGLGVIELMDYGTCPTDNDNARDLHVTFKSLASTSVTAACETGTPILNGDLLPSDLADFKAILNQDASLTTGTWYITILDNDDNNKHNSAAGVGQVTEVEMDLQTGFPTPYYGYDCSDFSVEMQMQMVLDNDCDLGDWVGSTIMRVWEATDTYGNSTTCEQLVELKAPTFTDIDIPENLVFDCADAPTTTPDITGYPTFACHEILAAQETACDVSVTYEDATSSGCNQRIIRTWTITNWCTTVSQTRTQTIDILDETGPEITTENLTIGSNIYSCEGDVFINPVVTDDCSGVDQVFATFTLNDVTETVLVDGATLIEDLPVGETTIYLLAKDACGNNTADSLTVTVIDDVSPTASCNDQLNVSVNGAGYARILATDINEGSLDNCGIADIKVRRKDGCLGESEWDNYVDFACCDVGTEVMVELRVTDTSGNSNKCWMVLEIFDETAPIVLCPPNKTINCHDNYTNLDNFGQATSTDNCEATVELTDSESHVNNCGAGYITRTFTATDLQGLTDVCTQTITVESVAGYTVSFPADVMIDDCAANIGDTGEPIFSNDGCGLISVTKTDVMLTVVPDACYKIMRTWYVMDWCVFDEDNPNLTNTGTSISPNGLTFEDDGDGYFEYIQFIKILDTEAPVITCQADITIESTSEACAEMVDLSISATDNCAAEAAFDYLYSIDLDNNGSIDIINDKNEFSYPFTFGTHKIYWQVSDGCGNQSNCEQLVTINDGNHPSVTCINGLAIELMGSGMAEIWASDFFLYGEDNCTNGDDLEASVLMRRANTTDTLSKAIEVTCADLGTIVIEIWVEDEAGNGGYCTTYLIVQDNQNVCTPSEARVAIAGHIRTENAEDIENAMVEILETSNAFPSSTNGNFGFDDLPMYQNYTIKANKNSAYLNGVSTADLVYINQHVLGINEFDSPYKYIAADANKDDKVSTFDMVLLRQLILYVITELPANDSWRFMDADYVFPNPQNPWMEAFPEHISFNQLEDDQMHTDFVGVKIGDVNGSAVPNTLLGADDRNLEETLVFVTKNQSYSKGNTVCIPLTAKDFNAINGFQFSFGFDTQAMDFEGVQAGALAISESNFGYQLLEEGFLTASFNTNEKLSFDDETVLFSLCFDTKKAGNLKESIHISSRYTAAEAYGNDVMNLQLDFANEINTNTTIALYQNTPNPFQKETTIGFFLPTASKGSLKIYDTTGRILQLIETDFQKGTNQITINLDTETNAGVLFYELTTPTFQATKKMVLLH